MSGGSDLTSWPAPVARGPLDVTVAVPGSKSSTNRALVLAALSSGTSVLTGGLDARDTRLMRDALRGLGAVIDDTTPARWEVAGPTSFTAGATIDCGLAGTVMRFVPPLAALAEGTTRFTGDAAAAHRPVGPLLDGLRQWGAGIDGTAIPFAITGGAKVLGGDAAIDASGSSQFVSGLLIAGSRFPLGARIRHEGGSVPSRPHIAMTLAMLRDRGVTADEVGSNVWRVEPGPVAAYDETIEPDLTNAAAFWAAALITGGRVRVDGLRHDTTQPAAALFRALQQLGAEVSWDATGVTVSGGRGIKGADLDLHEVSDATPVLAAVCALAQGRSVIRGVAHIRGHETDRLAALETELGRLGAGIRQTADGLAITPRDLHDGTFATYADHRMAHAGALLGLAVPGVVLDDVGCTSKTIADFPALWAGMLSGPAA